jgi:hypothetical protein
MKGDEVYELHGQSQQREWALEWQKLDGGRREVR